MQRIAVVLAAFAGLIVTGCATPMALRRQTTCQAETATDVHEQQVLDNLAMYLCDPYSVPSFSLATAGTNEMTDMCSGNLVFSWMRNTAGLFLFNAIGSTDAASRTKRQNWTMTPITDPRKLELMRCAYQRTLANCGVCGCECTGCPDCRKRFNKFYTGQEFGSKLECKDGEMKLCYKCDEDGRLANLVPGPVDSACVCDKCACKKDSDAASPCASCQPKTVDELPLNGPGLQDGTFPKPFNCKEDCPKPNSGIVNSECLSCDGHRWFCYSCNKKHVPKNCGYVGHCGCMYVWVPCGPGRDELAKLTLVILDFAVNTGAALPKKQVYAFLDSKLCANRHIKMHRLWCHRRSASRSRATAFYRETTRKQNVLH